MLFSSTTFLYLFLPLVLFFYFVVFKKSRLFQNIFLLIASLIFYAWGEPKFVFIMILSIVVNWLTGLIISKTHQCKTISKLLIIFNIVFNIGLLFIFKYLAFTGNIINKVFQLNLSIPTILLPIGISFFTFQAISYVVDVYRHNGQVQTNILYVGLYISFFPQLIAGPIVRYETISNEIKNRNETLDDFLNGFARFIVGLSKKVLLANSFAIVADQSFNAVADRNNISVMFGWLGAIAYTFQIFFDFGGYSDMAIGLGRMFGFHFLENFNYPYISTSITEFWRRWHISLGTWFRDYLYIPLGGNRCSKYRNIFNLFIVWFLTGVWHGANFTFIVWGLMYFILLVLEKLTGFYKYKKLKFFKWLYTIFFVLIGWVFFRSESISDAVLYLKIMFGLNENAFVDGLFTGWFTQNIVLIFIGILLSTPLFKYISQKTINNTLFDWIRVISRIILFILSVASLLSNSYNPFIYFNF